MDMRMSCWKRIVLLTLAVSCFVLNCVDLSSGGMTVFAGMADERYITPEQFGAKGDGVTDDTEAFRRCMESPVQKVILEKTYLICDYLTTERTKYFYSSMESGAITAGIICNPVKGNKGLSFSNGVTFENIAFSSTMTGHGTSPHGESYDHTSNVVFVEIWRKDGSFINCSFTNAITAVRGRKSSNSSVIPQKITLNNCTFEECKIPVQGYSEETVANACHFVNDGDVYSGDHCIYIERYGCRSLQISNCIVQTWNSDSGAAFQIYGRPKDGDMIPDIVISGCVIEANGVVSASAANVIVKDCQFYEQQNEQFIAWLESGSLKMADSIFEHSYAFSYANSEVEPEAINCSFKLRTDLGNTRCNFPKSSQNCTFIDWGGNVRLEGTSFIQCTFTKTGAHTLNGIYISNEAGYSISITDSRFRGGDVMTNRMEAVQEYRNCSTF